MSKLEAKSVTDTRNEIEPQENIDVRKKRVKAFFKDILRDVLPTALAAYLLFGVLFRIVVVQGESMYPTLDNGNVVFVRQINYEPSKGDIVVLNKDMSNITGGAEKHLIKRIIALEGDTVYIDFENGEVYVNNQLLDEPYIFSPTLLNEGAEFPCIVPEHSVFVLGDNRANSLDSRDSRLGCISEEDVMGKVLFSMLPPKKI